MPENLRRARKPPKPKPMKRIWRVEASVPRGVGDYGGGNLNCEVVAYTLEGVVEAVRAQYPEAVLHKIMCDRWTKDVIFAKEKQP